MNRKRLLVLLAFTLICISGYINMVNAEGTPPGNGPGLAPDDEKIDPRFGWTGNGEVIVTGSDDGIFIFPERPSERSWGFSLSGVLGTIEQAWLYIGTYDYDSTDGTLWHFNLQDPSGILTSLGPATSSPYDSDFNFGLFRYDVTLLLNGLVLSGDVNGAYRVSVEHLLGDFDVDAVYGVGIVVVYSDLSLPPVHVWINDGCEWIRDTSTLTAFPDQGQPPTSDSATLYTIVGGGDLALTDESISFQGVLLPGLPPFDSSNGVNFDVDDFNVKPLMSAGDNRARFYAETDGYFVYTAVLAYYPRSMSVIPEVPYGTITSMALLVLAFALYVRRPF